MMKIDKMPVALVLLIISWFFIALGVFAPAYLFISMGLSKDILIIGFFVFLVSLVLGALLRMFANIGQMIFDTKKEIQMIREINNNSLQHISGLNQSLKTELQNQTSEVDKIIKGLNQSISGGISGLNQSLKTELQNKTSDLDRIIQNLNLSLSGIIIRLNQSLKTELQNQTSEVDKIIKGLNQSISGGISGLNRELVSEIKLLTSSLQNLSSSCEQINCDSKDLNQNINQIKNFFEQIERHLDLKQ